MRVSSPRAMEFACHSKACAPPPAGKGGSDKGGGKKLNPDEDVYPDTLAWKATNHKVYGRSYDAGDYAIKPIGYDKLSKAFKVTYKGETVTQQSNLRIAKTAAEMHKAGVEDPVVRFWNVPKGS